MVWELAALKDDANHWLTDPEYTALRHGLETAHAAAEAALVEARRRVRLDEERGRSRRDQDCQRTYTVGLGLCQGRAPDGMLERPGLREDAGQVRGGRRTLSRSWGHCTSYGI